MKKSSLKPLTNSIILLDDAGQTKADDMSPDEVEGILQAIIEALSDTSNEDLNLEDLSRAQKIERAKRVLH